MEGIRRLLLLSLGVLLVFEYANGLPPLYGDNLFTSHQDMSGKLLQLKTKEAYLQKEMNRRLSMIEKMVFEQDLQNVRASIAQLESSTRVPYRDYLRTMSEQRQQFEMEKAELRKKLVEAENMRIQAMNAVVAQTQRKSQQIGIYQEKLDKLTADRNNIAKEYATFTDAYYQQDQKMKEERDRYLTEMGKLQQTLDEAQKKHAEALDAMTDVPTQRYKPTSIPEQDEINGLRTSITYFNGMKNRKQLKEGLETTRKELQELLDKLYDIGGFFVETDRNALANALNEMESYTAQKREEHENLRKELLEKMKQKGLTNYNEEEIAALKKTNQDVAALNDFQNELARRNAYLKGILEVSELLKECSEAIRDANDRNIANLWADAIQEAKDSPLAKMWADALNDAKDSDFTKAWVDAIQEIKDSPLAKMWTDAIESAKSSPFSQYFLNAFQEAKKTISNINFNI